MPKIKEFLKMISGIMKITYEDIKKEWHYLDKKLYFIIILIVIFALVFVGYYFLAPIFQK